MRIRHVLFDLDGVVRNYNQARMTQIVEHHGFSLPNVLAVAFEPARLKALVTGEIRRQEWIDEIGSTLGNRTAAIAWGEEQPVQKEPVVAFVAELRSAGYQVGLLTNGSNETRSELTRSGLFHRFDHVFNSAEIGEAKPASGVYRTVTKALGCEAGEIFFTDDHEANVLAARSYGWEASVFVGLDQLRSDFARVEGVGAKTR